MKKTVKKQVVYWSYFSLIMLSFMVISVIIINNSKTDPPNFQETQPERALVIKKPYKIKKHISEQEKATTKVLFIYSLNKEDGRGLTSLKNLKQILESHWNTAIDLVDYTSLDTTQVDKYDNLIFVEQNHHDEAVDKYMRIATAHNKPVLWIGYGTDKLIRYVNKNKEWPDLDKTSKIDRITYKGVDFFSIDEFFSLQSTLPGEDKDVEVLATYTTTENQEYPLVVRLNEKYILVPFTVPSYYKSTSYTLPFLDIFHHFLGHHNDNEKASALLRLEDINVDTYNNPIKLRAVHEFLASSDIPFHVAFIERYINPQLKIDNHSHESSRFLNEIKRIVESGDGVLVQHGYTHQEGDGISGVDFEFWDEQINMPLSYDSREFTINKILDVQEAMRSAGLPIPDIWETPHYAQSDLNNTVFNEVYPLRYEHIPKIGSLPFVAQFYDTIFIPENLGYVHDTDSQTHEKTNLLRQLSTFEDPVASVFWHPWRDISEIKQIAATAQSEGYEFVSAYDLVEKIEFEDEPVHITVPSTFSEDILIYTVLAFFVLGAFIYGFNVHRVIKYLGRINNHKVSLKKLESIAKVKKVSLPKIALLVPARNEGLVIENTLKTLSKIEYPKRKMKVFVIVDERELDDDVERTTKEVAKKTAALLHRRFRIKFVEIIEVPKWYSGLYGNKKKTYAKSTKGRALNYCLQKTNSNDIDMIGIYDADARPHKNILKEVALNRIENGSKLLQGPVFQVSNFRDVNTVGKAAGLELSLHHLTVLPARLNKKRALQFLAGTNYFIDTQSIKDIGGWDLDALVEDAELAVRMYTQKGIAGQWLNSPEIEQTPANFSVYIKQRERWMRGHLDLLGQIKNSSLPFYEKSYLYYKILLSQFRFILDLGLPIMAVYLMITGEFAYLHPVFKIVTIALLFTSIFIWDTYGFMFRKLAIYIDPKMGLLEKVFKTIKLLIFLPLFIIVQVIPKFQAIYNFVLHPNKATWYKTERTREKALS